MTRSRRGAPVDPRIRRPALVTAAVAVVVFGLAVVELAHGAIGPWGAAAGFAGGLPVGLLAARIQRIGWDDRAARVVARVDRVGLAILVGLVVATLTRNWLLEHWIPGALLAALGLWISVGTLLGRLIGTRRGVVAALRGTSSPRHPSEVVR